MQLELHATCLELREAYRFLLHADITLCIMQMGHHTACRYIFMQHGHIHSCKLQSHSNHAGRASCSMLIRISWSMQIQFHTACRYNFMHNADSRSSSRAVCRSTYSQHIFKPSCRVYINLQTACRQTFKLTCCMPINIHVGTQYVK